MLSSMYTYEIFGQTCYVAFNKIQSLALAQSTDGQFKSPQANILNLNFLKYIVLVCLTKTSQCDKDFFVSFYISRKET